MHVIKQLLCFSILITSLLCACTAQSYEPADVVFSLESGACPEYTVLYLSAPEHYVIRYTTDGRLPDEHSRKYTGGIILSKAADSWLNEKMIDRLKVKNIYRLNASEDLPDAVIIRAAAFAPDGTKGSVSTRTYFPGRSLVSDYGGVMVISLVCEPDSLFDYETGILVKGKVFDDWLQEDGSEEILDSQSRWWEIEANYTRKGKQWERPVSLELFDGSDSSSLQTDAGLRIHGSASRMYTHKSFRICFRKDYGTKEITYDLFPADGFDSYKYIILRNGGNESNKLIFKDGWTQSLLSGRAFLTQNTRPAVVFLNGEYWGVYCMNDRYCGQYLEEHYGINDYLIIKEGEYEDGNESATGLYQDLRSFEERDMGDSEVWEQFISIMDVRSMADYYAAEIYIANYDFSPDKNMELWRSVNVDPDIPYCDGKWRYMLYDTEYSSGLYNDSRTPADRNSLADVMEKDPLFASAMKSPEFRDMFLTSLKQIGSSDLSPERIEKTLDEWAEMWRPLMDDQYLRFGDYSAKWEEEISLVKDFYRNRYRYIIAYAEEVFSD